MPLPSHPSRREAGTEFKTGGVILSAMFTTFGTTAIFPSFGPLKTWTSLQIGWRGKGVGAWLAGTATKIFCAEEFVPWRRCAERDECYVED
jgi:hypothetical protein